MLNKWIHDRAVQVRMHVENLSQSPPHMVLCIVQLCASRTHTLCGLRWRMN
jgi:hypothetical protein